MKLLCLGSIIRCMRRLEELLRQMCQAAKAIGNTDLENKFAGGMYVHKKLSYCMVVSEIGSGSVV